MLIAFPNSNILQIYSEYRDGIVIEYRKEIAIEYRKEIAIGYRKEIARPESNFVHPFFHLK